MMNKTVYSEVYQILQYLPESEYRLIPKSQIDFFKKNMDKNAKKVININSKIEDINLSVEAQKILFKIFYIYIATKKQKEKIDYIFNNVNNKKIKNNNLYCKKKLFNNNVANKYEKEKNTSLVVINKNNSILYKIKNLFKNIFDFFVK